MKRFDSISLFTYVNLHLAKITSRARSLSIFPPSIRLMLSITNLDHRQRMYTSGKWKKVNVDTINTPEKRTDFFQPQRITFVRVLRWKARNGYSTVNFSPFFFSSLPSHFSTNLSGIVSSGETY